MCSAKLTIYPACYNFRIHETESVNWFASKTVGYSFDLDPRLFYSLTDRLYKFMGQHSFIAFMRLHPNDRIIGPRKSGRYNYAKAISNLYPVSVI